MKRLSILLPAVLVALALAAGPAQAGPFSRDKGGHEQIRLAKKGGEKSDNGRRGKASQGPSRGQEMSAREAGETARKRYGGQVLDVRPSSGGSYRVKLLNHGEVRTVTIPGGTGK